MEKLLICYISGGLELLGIDKFNVGGLKVLEEIEAVNLKPEDDKGKIACELIDKGLSIVIADDEMSRDKKLAITKIIGDIELPNEKHPLLCMDISKKCFTILLQFAEPEINKRTVEAWDDFFEIAARTAAASIPSEITGEIEKVKYLFNQFPDIPKAGLSYLRYCYRGGKLPPEEEWLPEMLNYSDTYKGEIDLTTEVLACLV